MCRRGEEEEIGRVEFLFVSRSSTTTTTYTVGSTGTLNNLQSAKVHIRVPHTHNFFQEQNAHFYFFQAKGVVVIIVLLVLE